MEKKVSGHNHEKYITTPELNKLTTEILKARLAQANTVNIDLSGKYRQIQILILNCKILVKELLQIKQTICLLKIN